MPDPIVDSWARGDLVPRDLVATALAEAWEDGYNAGHQDARAVQKTYPDPTPNPYRTEEGQP